MRKIETIQGCCNTKRVDHSRAISGGEGESPTPLKSLFPGESQNQLKLKFPGTTSIPDSSTHHNGHPCKPHASQILHFTLKRKWFDLIKSGKKKVEFRETKDYWDKRLNKNCMWNDFELVHFRNGYLKDSPEFYARYEGVTIINHICHGWVYAIALGEIYDR